MCFRVTDRTQPGHTLGAVEHRSREAVPERRMSAAACALIRFLTHAALFISASQTGQVGSGVCLAGLLPVAQVVHMHRSSSLFFHEAITPRQGLVPCLAFTYHFTAV